MNVLNKADILAADDLPVAAVPVPEWGGSVHVRALTGTERDQFEEWVAGRKPGDERPSSKAVRGRLASLVICDEKGRRLFTDDESGMLGDKAGKALDRVILKARDLSGMAPGDAEEARGN